MTDPDRLTVHGIELEVLRRGKGRPILVLHGFDTIDPETPFLDLLGRYGELIVPAHPGFGHSPRPKDFDTVYDLVHLYPATLDALPKDKVTLLGFSFGGWLAAEVGAACRHRLDKLVLVDPIGIKVSDRETPDILDIFNRSPDEVRRRSWHDPDRFAPAAPADLVGRSVEDVEDVRRLTIAHFDADRIDEDELVQPMAACRANLRGEPTAEGEPEQRHLVVRQRVESCEIEMHQVIDRIEILGSRRMAEPGMCRDDELAVAAEKIEKGRLGIDRVEAVQYEDRTPLAPTQHFELDPVDRQPVRIRHGSLPPGEACGELDGDRLGSPVVDGELDE